MEKDKILSFIDSPDIREYNKEQTFLPAQQAVLIDRSYRKSVEDKAAALEELIHSYTEDDFGFMELDGRQLSYREVAKNTLRQWREALEARFHKEGVIYIAKLDEKNYRESLSGSLKAFSTYEKAYENICQCKKEYLDDERLKDVETVAEIFRVKIDDMDSLDASDFGYYCFDTNMTLIDASPADSPCSPDYRVLADFHFYLPLPFKKGDIVKCESPFDKTYYGVFASDWEIPENRYRISMNTSLDVYDEKEHIFDFTDDTTVLSLSYCTDEELPKDQKMLKVLRAVRKGELDFYSILYQSSINQLEEFAEWYSR